jgi:hypothetical protein
MATAPKSPVINADPVEREIVARLRAAKLHLRFDKVAMRFVGGLKAVFADVVPEGQVVVFTISAPIRLPGKTAVALESMVRSGPRDVERREIVHDNEVGIRWLRGGPKHIPKVLGFVHSLASDADAILALVEALILEPSKDK